MASTWSAPWCSSPSSAYSRPGMNPSTSANVVRVVPLGADVGRLDDRAEPVEGRDERRRSSSARITPRLPDSATGLSTQGYESGVGSRIRDSRFGSRESAVVCPPARTRAPAGPRRADTRACAACCARSRRPRANDTEARAPRRRAPRSPSADRRRRARRRAAAGARPRESRRRRRLRRRNESESRWSRQGSSMMWHRSVANTSSTPSRSAASPNARV